MSTIAFELVPTSAGGSLPLAKREVQKVKAALQRNGLYDRINTFMLPHIISEDSDRPVPLDEKMDPLDFSRVITKERIDVDFILSQVTVFTTREDLEARLKHIRSADIERLVFVGIPREIGGRAVVGPFPNEAMSLFRDLMPYRGAVLIPTRPDEETRLLQKLDAGANFVLTQMLFSDQIVSFLKGLPERQVSPEILLSFAYVPNVESRVGLLRWLIRDETSSLVNRELEEIATLARVPFKEKKARLLDLYKRIVDGLAGSDAFRVGLHFECPYGVSEPALETFAAMLEVWSPEQSAKATAGKTG